MWIFGYGSLVWRPGFDFAEACPGYITGYARRFYQGSTDHRGTEDAPGRVVTLLDAPQEICWGVAYRLKPKNTDRILRALDHREKGGYDRREVEVQFSEARAPITALVYIATQDNDNYLGPAPMADMALQICESKGPSGPNRLYLLELHRALLDMGTSDPHVEALVRALTKIDYC